MAVLVLETPAKRQVRRTFAEPLTFAFALSFAILAAILGWQAHALASALRTDAPELAERYVEALCGGDVAHLQRMTGEAAGRMPWEPRLSSFIQPCTGHRYMGSLQDVIGRDQHVFTLLRPDGTEAVYIVTIGRDGRVAGID